MALSTVHTSLLIVSFTLLIISSSQAEFIMRNLEQLTEEQIRNLIDTKIQ